MITVKEAVKIAIDKLTELYSLNKDEFKDILLEEVELSDDNRFWNITLGFSRPVPELPTNPLQALAAAASLNKNYKREYKVFKLDADSGEIRAMKIRTV
jgi:hypothetical protein